MPADPLLPSPAQLEESPLRDGTSLRLLSRPEAGPVPPCPGPASHLSPELTESIRKIRIATDTATLLILLIAALVFLPPTLGASLP